MAPSAKPGSRTARLFVICVVLFFSQTLAAALAPLVGTPPMTRYTPDLGLFPQNFALAQLSDGHVFVANSEAIMVFDGSQWQSVELPDWSYARVLAHDEDRGRLYVGGYDDFGYLTADGFGGWTYTSLTPLLDPSVMEQGFADIWFLTVTEYGVFFGALKHQFLYQPDTETIRTWQHEGRFGFGVVQQGRFVLQFRGEGLRAFEGEDFQPIEGSEFLSRLISHVVVLADQRLLMATNIGWITFDGSQFEELAQPPEQEALDATSLLLLDDGSVAVGTVAGEVLMYQPNNGSSKKFRVTNQHIGDLARDIDGGLLALVDNGLFYIGWPARWTMVDSSAGISSGIYDLALWNERLYVTTSAGVFQQMTDDKRSSAPVRFELLPWPAFEVWRLLPLTSTQAMMADSYALKLIDNGVSLSLSDETLYPRELLMSRYQPQRLFVGTEQGYAIAERGDDGWQLIQRHDNISGRVLTMAEASATTLLLGTEGDGAIKITLDTDSGEEIARHALGADDGIAYGEYPNALMFELSDGTLGASTERGVFQWSNDRFVELDIGKLSEVLGQDELVQISEVRDGELWALSYNQIYRRDGEGNWHREPVDALLDGAVAAITAYGDSTLVTTGSRILLFDETGYASHTPTPRVALREVSQTVDGTETRLQLAPQQAIEHPYGPNSIEFSWTAPILGDSNDIRFQARLSGTESRQSPWRKQTSIGYSRLAPGNYQFQVFVRDTHGNESAIPPYAFTVSPPWYWTKTALFIWVILAISALALFTRLVVMWHGRTLQHRALALEQEVATRTRELRQANKRLDAMAHVDGLTGIANRRRLEEMLEECWASHADSPSPITLLLIDVDRFKQFNDQHGHLAGDVLLRRLGDLLQAWVSPDQLAARYGGEEFTLVLPGIGRTEGLQLAEDLRQAIERADLGSTVSIGVACADRDHDFAATSPQELVDAADHYMYAAKAAGRNRVMPRAA